MRPRFLGMQKSQAKELLHCLSLTLAKNRRGSSGAGYSKHGIVLDDLMSTVEHQFHAAEVTKGGPSTFGNDQ